MNENTITGATNSPPPTELTNLFPGFRVDTLSSHSNTGTTYKGVQISLDRDITVKILPTEVSFNSESRQLFERDAKTMARLNHQNLVDVYDFGEVNDMLYMITEHIPGRTLYETTLNKHINQLEAARLILDICQGLHCAHSAGVPHLGLNPTNLLLNEDAEVKIVDFGVSNLIHNEHISDLAGYCAPEIVNHSNEIDLRADIYSAGIILYELIVGYVPSNPYTPPSLLRGSSPLIDHIILRALQPNPDDRYSSAHEMAADLKAFFESLPDPTAQEDCGPTTLTAAPTSGLRQPTTQLSNTTPRNNSALLITLLIITGVCLAAYYYSKQLSPPETLSEAPIATEAEPVSKPTPQPASKASK